MELATALSLSPTPAHAEVIAFVGAGGKSSAMHHLAGELRERGHRLLVTTTTHIAEQQSSWFGPLIDIGSEPLPLDRIAIALADHGICLVAGSALHGKRSGISSSQIDQIVSETAALQLSAVLIEADGSRGLPVKAPAAHEPAAPRSTTLLVSVLGLDGIGAPIREQQMHRPQEIRRLLELPPGAESIRLTPAMAAHLLAHGEGGCKGAPPGARCVHLLNKADSALRLALARLTARRLTGKGHSALIGAVGRQESTAIAERWAPLAAVVLAGGEGRRLTSSTGRAKQLTEVDGQVMLARAVRVALRSDAQTVLVVTGAYAGDIEPTLVDLSARAGGRLHWVFNADWPSGQASSVRTALNALPPGVGAALFLPVDQPFLQPVLLDRLAMLWRRGARLAAPAVDGEARGAPAIFDRTLWPDLLAVQGDVGGRPLLQRHRAELVTVETPAAWLRDIDKPEDLAQWGASAGR